MPNGDDKNWVRPVCALEGFYAWYGRWPTRIRLARLVLDDLRRHQLTRASWLKVKQKVTFVVDDSVGVVAEDDDGGLFDYGAGRGAGESAAHEILLRAAEWLGVEPDRAAHHE